MSGLAVAAIFMLSGVVLALVPRVTAKEPWRRRMYPRQGFSYVAVIDEATFRLVRSRTFGIGVIVAKDASCNDGSEYATDREGANGRWCEGEPCWPGQRRRSSNKRPAPFMLVECLQVQVLNGLRVRSVQPLQVTMGGLAWGDVHAPTPTTCAGDSHYPGVDNQDGARRRVERDDRVKDSAANAKGRGGRDDLVVARALLPAGKAHHPLCGVHHHAADALIGIVDELIEPDDSRCANRQVCLIEERDLSRTRRTGGNEFVLEHSFTGGETPALTTDRARYLLLDSCCRSNGGLC